MVKSTSPVIHTLYNRPSDPGIDFTLPSYTQQRFKDDVDVNNIISRLTRAGVPLPPQVGLEYYDLTDLSDYQSALELIRDADDQFYNLPSHIRDYFRNDPALLLEFSQDERNYDKAVELGLIVKRLTDSEAGSSPGVTTGEQNFTTGTEPPHQKGGGVVTDQAVLPGTK